MSDPLASELGIIADEAAYGRDVSEAIRAMAERLDIQDLRFLAVAVGIQQKSGGNLAEILQGLADVIRARFKLFRKVKAITAEAKWSGMFLSFFPILCLVGINVMQPDYYADVMEPGLHPRLRGRGRHARREHDLHAHDREHQGLSQAGDIRWNSPHIFRPRQCLADRAVRRSRTDDRGGRFGVLLIVLVLPAALKPSKRSVQKLKDGGGDQGAEAANRKPRGLRVGGKDDRLDRFSQYLQPQDQEELSASQMTMMRAGYRSKSAVQMFHFLQLCAASAAWCWARSTC
jgi:hypothetical protein